MNGDRRDAEPRLKDADEPPATMSRNGRRILLRLILLASPLVLLTLAALSLFADVDPVHRSASESDGKSIRTRDITSPSYYTRLDILLLLTFPSVSIIERLASLV